MSAFSRLERFLERALEGTVQRVFRPGLHPVDIARQVERAVDDGRRAGLRGDVAPNQYVIILSAADRASYFGIEPQLASELRGFVRDVAAEREYRLLGPVSVTFEWSPGVPRGSVRVIAEHVEPERAGPGPSPAATVVQPPAAGQAESPPDATVRLTVAALQGAPALFIDAGTHERRVPLTQPVTTLGRELDNDVVLDDQRVSRYHLRVSLESGEIVIEDLESTNGTYLNGRRVRRASLHDGDALIIGGVSVRVRWERDV